MSLLPILASEPPRAFLIGFAIFFGLLGVTFLLLAIAGFVLWIMMLIDAAKRTDWKDDNEKNLWIILLIVSFFMQLNGVAALVYYFVISQPRPLPTAKKR